MTAEQAKALLAEHPTWRLLYVARERRRAVAVVRRLGLGARCFAYSFERFDGIGVRGDIIVFDWMGVKPQGLERARVGTLITTRLCYGGRAVQLANAEEYGW